MKKLPPMPRSDRATIEEAEQAVITLLNYLGEDVHRDGLLDTPRRVVSALHEMTAGVSENPKQILSTCFDVKYDEMVVVRDIEFWSLCEHHLLPFHGRATVAYLPGKKIVGLSKLARLVFCFARRLQVQERLTSQIAHAMNEHLEPIGVGVVMRATHLCMCARGAKAPAEMVTSCLLGAMKEDASARAEFLALARPN